MLLLALLNSLQKRVNLSVGSVTRNSDLFVILETLWFYLYLIAHTTVGYSFKPMDVSYLVRLL